MARLSITKHKSYSGRSYYTTSKGYERIPEHLTSFLSDYRVIGKLVYVPSATTGKNPTPEWSLEKIKELMQKHGKSATLKSVMLRNPTEKKWAAADAKQALDYFKRRRTLELWVEQYMVKREKAQRQHTAKVALSIVSSLRKQGMVSEEALALVETDVAKYIGAPLTPVVTEVPKAG